MKEDRLCRRYLSEEIEQESRLLLGRLEVSEGGQLLRKTVNPFARLGTSRREEFTRVGCCLGMRARRGRGWSFRWRNGGAVRSSQHAPEGRRSLVLFLSSPRGRRWNGGTWGGGRGLRFLPGACRVTRTAGPTRGRWREAWLFRLLRSLTDLLSRSKDTALEPNLCRGLALLLSQSKQRGGVDGVAQAAEDLVSDLISLALEFRGVLHRLFRARSGNSGSTPHLGRAGVRVGHRALSESPRPGETRPKICPHLEIVPGSWFTPCGVTYFFVFVVTLVVGAMAALIVSERRKRAPSGAVKNEARFLPNSKRRAKRRRKK
jgi:hypothetical protein